MSDCVVTVPMNFTWPGAPGLRGLDAWAAEGDLAGEPESGREWYFTSYGTLPVFVPGDRLYIVCEGRLRGYALLVNVFYDESKFRHGQAPIAFVRRGGAVAVTIPARIAGFRGWRRRWWDRQDELPFPDWRTADRRRGQRLEARG